MSSNMLTIEKMPCALTLLEQGMSVIQVDTDLKISKSIIYQLKHSVAQLPPSTIPRKKLGYGCFFGVGAVTARSDITSHLRIMSVLGEIFRGAPDALPIQFDAVHLRL